MDIIKQIKAELGNKAKKFVEKNPQRYYIDIDASDLIPVATNLFSDFGCRFAIASGMDMPEGVEILYHFSHDPTGKMISVRVVLKDKNKPEVESLTKVIVGVSWIEREMHELLGINFVGHPNLKRLLLPEDWPEGEYPLRHKEKGK